MDLKSLLQRFDGRFRLLVHVLHLGGEGASKAQTVFSKQRRSDPQFSLTSFLETLCQQEAYLHQDVLSLKPLVCLFSEGFKHNLLCFLHLLHPGLPKNSVQHLLQCLNEDDRTDQWISALSTQLQRDIDGVRTGSLVSTNCLETLKQLSEKFRDPGTKRRWASCFEEVEEKDSDVLVSSQKRKSDNIEQDACFQEDHQSKRLKTYSSPSKDEEQKTEEKQPDVRRSQLEQMAASRSLAGSDQLGSSKHLSEHLKVAVPVIKELLNAESGWDEGAVSKLRVFHDCDLEEVELLCSALGLSDAPEQCLPQFCSCLLALTPDLSHSTACALITHLLLEKVGSLSEPASRCLVTAVLSFSSRYPRPTCQSLIQPILQKGQIGGAQAELLCRLVIDSLEQHHRLLVFRMAVGVSWDENVLSIIHALLDTKLEMNEEDFSIFTEQLFNQSPYFSKSVKFAKMLLSVLTKYQANVNPTCHHTLTSCLSFSETFLKKSLQVALKRIPL
ncbi:hypothetical protein DNTS_012009 [Danionella cerebrum]|uniref:Fanconi Anaemia group E protein C-terminal domain-containing protein n=1 Tax=Danionella cerebrum TaxID=2873325 RepID=A0A553N3V4_9TELE|nr:hypothetical protein DNTS_012009 [Danionella translucida]